MIDTATVRAREAKQLQDSGLTYKQIGEEMGRRYRDGQPYSVARVQVWIAQFKRRDREALDPRNEMGVKTANALSKAGLFTPEDILAAGRKGLLAVENIGPKAASEALEWAKAATK